MIFEHRWNHSSLLFLTNNTSGGQDYIPISESVTLRTNDISHCFQLTTLEDDILEDERENFSLVVSLSQREERVYLQQESVDVTIIDNDGIIACLVTS